MPKLLDYSNFCEELPEITTTKIMDKKKFHPKGLFSEQIFGPLRNYTCQCGDYYGISKSGGVCKLCNVDIVNSNERRKRYAKIRLPIPVVNPLFYDLITDISDSSFKADLDKLMKNEKSILVVEDGLPGITIDPSKVPPNTRVWERTDAIEKLVFLTASDNEDLPEWKLVKDNIDRLIIDSIIVLPPDLRPAAKGISRNNQVLDKINRYYMQILQKKEVMSSTNVELTTDKQLYYNYFKQLQKDVSELYQHILEKMSKKQGLIRGNILGKRIDFSGRAVIVPDPTLKLNECKLPYLMFLEIFKIKAAKKLIEHGKFKLINKAIDYIDECLESRIYSLYDICEELSIGEVCILNRQPSLHRLGMLSFDIKLTKDSVIKIHPLICPPFNADFDGDQMAVYIPISKEAKEEVREKLFITKNLKSPANESLTTIPSQDIILGIYALTSNHISGLEEKEIYKDEELNKGEIIFNKALPDNYPVEKGIIRKNKLMRILNNIKDNYSEEETAEVLDNIKLIGFKYSTIFGATMSLDGCEIEGAGEARDELYKSTDTREQLAAFSDPKTLDILKDHFKYSYMIESGARGSWDQVKQLVLSRGFISNFDGEILESPIKHSLLEGLTESEFFNSTYGSRKGLLDVALNTGTSGYLSRKLIFACANLQIDGTLDNCGTTDCLEVYVKDKKKSRMLVGRYYQEPGKLYGITKENCVDLVGKTIMLRSPVFCKSQKVCHKCYGDLYKSLHSRFIGVIAAQTLGERGTQLVLRTFHTSGAAVMKAQHDGRADDMKQSDIIGDLSTVANILHKFQGKNYKMIIDELYDVYGTAEDIYHVHFECVVSQLMWSEHRKWRLLDNRDSIEPSYYSVQSVPSHESWILGLAFSNPKRHILKGILHSGHYSGVMDRILLGEKI